eukprot:TRINITY_DN8626_c0_g1_i1.p1 TRINITY_DN8626_c0_g1~~TRINITY_DN8626_c0_g1_i1.p1  ORF type:complete len:258 (-),score=14.81 TRINITY_DN8626_c0_g1_i1:28-801(-)
MKITSERIEIFVNRSVASLRSVPQSIDTIPKSTALEIQTSKFVADSTVYELLFAQSIPIKHPSEDRVVYPREMKNEVYTPRRRAVSASNPKPKNITRSDRSTSEPQSLVPPILMNPFRRISPRTDASDHSRSSKSKSGRDEKKSPHSTKSDRAHRTRSTKSNSSGSRSRPSHARISQSSSQTSLSRDVRGPGYTRKHKNSLTKSTSRHEFESLNEANSDDEFSGLEKAYPNLQFSRRVSSKNKDVFDDNLIYDASVT